MACDQGLARGVILGIAGALAGTFGGYQVRMRLVKAVGTWDQSPLADRVGVVEDVVALVGSLWVVSRFSRF